MKTGIHSLNDVNTGDILVVEKYFTGEQLPDYWYKRPWRVSDIIEGKVMRLVFVKGINKNDTSKTTEQLKSITENMFQYAKFYKLTHSADVKNWIENQRYQD